MAGKELRTFLTNLSKDVSARNKYQADPVEAMKAANLSDSEIIAVLSQDPAKIQQEVGGDTAAIRVRVIITILVEL
jgi:hypothetical protein